MTDPRYDIANRIGDKVLGADGKLGDGSGRAGPLWWVMFALCLAFYAWTLLPGLLTLVEGTDAGIPSWLLVATGGGVVAVGGMLLMCGMFIAELTRRGTIGKSAKPRARGNFGVRFRLLSLPLHLVWLFGLLLSAVAMLAVPMLADVGTDVDTFFTWYLWGVFLVPVCGAVLGSFLKKVCYFRWLRRVGAAGLRKRKPQPFWRWYSYRWRLDLWLCGAGFVLVAAAGFILGMLTYLPSDEFGDADDIAEATGVVWALFVIGVPVLLFGLWSCSQFWRAGEDIDTGESAS